MRSKTERDGVLKGLQCKIPRGEALLLTFGSDITYFSGFYSKGEMLLIPSNGGAICFVDSMNRSLAQKELNASGIKIVSGRMSVPDMMVESVRKMKLSKVALDMGNVSAMLYKFLARRLKGVSLISVIATYPVRDVLDRVRAIKDSEEISRLRFAARETVRIWNKASRRIHPGMTELEIAKLVDVMIRKAGYENSFPTIVATGVNSAYPHAIPGKRKLGKKEHVVVDFGIRHKLYCSDLTRIWGECRISGQIRDLCKNVRELQREAIDLIGPGVFIKKTAEKINSMISERGLGRFVMHGLGHGVGLDVHESPNFGIRSEGCFEEGMVLTVEPGLYVPGKGGSRIEDMVLVTPKGREVLTA